MLKFNSSVVSEEIPKKPGRFLANPLLEKPLPNCLFSVCWGAVFRRYRADTMSRYVRGPSLT